MNDHQPWPDGWRLPEPSEEEGRVLDLYLHAAEHGIPGLVFVPPAPREEG